MSFRLGAIVATAGLLVLPSCVSQGQYRDLQAANDALQRQIADLERYQAELQGENRRLGGEVERLGKNAADADYLSKRRAELEDLIARFREGGTSAIPGVNVIRTREGVAFQMQGEVLFESGKADVTTSGSEVLRRLLSALQAHPYDIRVDGHTDSDPIRHSSWKTNLRLSAERAIAVTEFLTRNGIDASRVHIAAFGEHRPSVEGDNDAAKRQNRRVEILMVEP